MSEVCVTKQCSHGVCGCCRPKLNGNLETEFVLEPTLILRRCAYLTIKCDLCGVPFLRGSIIRFQQCKKCGARCKIKVYGGAKCRCCGTIRRYHPDSGVSDIDLRSHINT